MYGKTLYLFEIVDKYDKSLGTIAVSQQNLDGRTKREQFASAKSVAERDWEYIKQHDNMAVCAELMFLSSYNDCNTYLA